MKFPILPLIAAAALLASSFSIARTQPKTVSEDPPSPPPESPFQSRIAAVGLIEPRSETISLSAFTPGVVETVRVRAGQRVSSGDLLVSLESRALRAQLQSRRAELISAQAQLRQAEARHTESGRLLAMISALADPRAVSEEVRAQREGDHEAAIAAVAVAQAGIALQKAQIAETETELERRNITAPIDGTVLQVRIRPGEYAASPTDEPWLTLGDLSTMHVRVDIDESEAWRLVEGAPAVVQVRGNSSLSGTARFVRVEPMLVPKRSLTGSVTERVDTRVLQAIYALEAPLPPVQVGQQVDVFIQSP